MYEFIVSAGFGNHSHTPARNKAENRKLSFRSRVPHAAKMRAMVWRVGAIGEANVNPLLWNEREWLRVAFVPGIPSPVLHVGLGWLAVLVIAAANRAVRRHSPLLIKAVVDVGVFRRMLMILREGRERSDK
jgi:hypothetical protein